MLALSAGKSSRISEAGEGVTEQWGVRVQALIQANVRGQAKVEGKRVPDRSQKDEWSTEEMCSEWQTELFRTLRVKARRLR